MVETSARQVRRCGRFGASDHESEPCECISCNQTASGHPNGERIDMRSSDAELSGHTGEGEMYRLRTNNDYYLDEVVSSLTKEIRRGNEDAALYWALEMVDGGYANYFWNRLGVITAEEVGLADPIAIAIVNSAAQMYERRVKKWSEGPHTHELVGLVILYLCRSPKNAEVSYATYSVMEERDRGRRDPIPEYGQDMHTVAGRNLISKSGMSREEEALWWWRELSRRENLTRGNRWISRWVSLDKDLSPETRRQVIQEEMQAYGELQENQV